MSFSLTNALTIIGCMAFYLITGYLNPGEGKDLRHVLMLVARVPSKQHKVRLKKHVPSFDTHKRSKQSKGTETVRGNQLFARTG